MGFQCPYCHEQREESKGFIEGYLKPRIASAIPELLAINLVCIGLIVGAGIALEWQPHGGWIALFVVCSLILFYCNVSYLVFCSSATSAEREWAAEHQITKHGHTRESLRLAYLKDIIRHRGKGGLI